MCHPHHPAHHRRVPLEATPRPSTRSATALSCAGFALTALLLLVAASTVPAPWMAVSRAEATAGSGGSGLPDLRGEYLGQPLPGERPAIFAPGVICTGMYERDVAIAPDGEEIFFGLIQARTVTIMHTRRIEGRWTEPCVAPFASDPDFFHLEPCLAPDGKRILFLSTRPPADRPPLPGWGYQDIWVSDRRPDGSWGEAYNLGAPVNSDGEEYFPSLTRDGTLYFTRGQGQEASAIWRARPLGAGFSEPEKLPAPVNQSPFVYNACIAPDESYLVACVRAEQGNARYLVFFRDPDDTWSEGIDPGEMVNPPGINAISPSLSPDGRYFFFASTLGSDAVPPPAAERTVKHFLDRHTRPRNGSADLYWVDATMLTRLRPVK